MKKKIISISLLLFCFSFISINTLNAEEAKETEKSTDSKESAKNEEELIQDSEELAQKNEELAQKNEELERKKKIAKETQEEIDKNKEEIESLQKDLVQANKAIKTYEKDLKEVEKQSIKTLRILQKNQNNNLLIILFDQIKNSNSLEELAIKVKVVSTFSEELNNTMFQLIDQLNILEKNKAEIEEKTRHLEKVTRNLEEKLREYTDDIRGEASSLETLSRGFYTFFCDSGEVYGKDCGEDLPEAKGFKFPIERGSVTNEFAGWDALDQADGHTGIDLIGDEKIKPAAPGEVLEVTVDAYGGIQVMMIHNVKGKNYITNYAHLSEVNVVPGDILTTNDVLGIMGDTGMTTGVHLHFEIIEGPYYIHSSLENPRNYLDFPAQGYVEFERE